jgi:hypothetical protein
MGSGGMFSTLEDMDRFYTAAASGSLPLGEAGRRRFTGETVGVGGSDRGFFIFHASDGRGDSVLLLINGEGRSPTMRALTRQLSNLVMDRS